MGQQQSNLNSTFKNQTSILMEFDYFEEQGETVIQNQDYSSSQQFQEGHQQPSNNNPDEQFDFGDGAQDSGANNQPSYSPFEEDQATIRIRQEEERIQQQLRQRANQQYEEKMRRKEAGRRELEQFLEQAEREKTQRKERNIEKEKETREQIKKLNENAGWRKVGANVPLKQGEHTGTKDITRMREAIINKRSDQL